MIKICMPLVKFIQYFFLKKKKNRGNYRCSRCNLPKKGHVCPYQPVFRRRDQSQVDTTGRNSNTIAKIVTFIIYFADISIQVEIDSEMTVAKLGPLSLQGTAESYLPTSTIPAPESQLHDSAN